LNYKGGRGPVKYSVYVKECGSINLDPYGRNDREKGACMEEIRQFVAGMIKQTEEDLAFERRSETEKGWLKFLEGKLQAFKLVQGFLEEMRRRKEELH
jgi:hypothetical protein